MYCEKEKKLNAWEYVYVVGKVYGENKKPIANALVMAEEISEYSNNTGSIEYVVTNEEGKYSIKLRNSNSKYKLTVFQDKNLL